MSDNAPRGTLGTVHNAATLLRLLSDGPSHHQLTDLAERSGMSLATVHRLLRSLTAAGLVEQDPQSSRYGLGPELVRLSERYVSRHPVLTVAGPYLVELRNATRGTVQIAALAGQDVVVLDRIDGDDAGGVYRDASRIHPATDTAVGRLLLAHEDDAWDAVGPSAGFDIDDRKRWQTEPVVVHLPESPAERPDIAAPVFGSRGLVAAIGVTGSPVTFTEEVLRTSVAPQLIRAATTVSRAMGAG